MSLSYCHSNNFKADAIRKLNYTISSQLYLSPYYDGSTRKILVPIICLKPFNSMACIKLWNSSNANDVTSDVRLKSNISLISSKSLISSIRLKVMAFEVSWNHDFVELLEWDHVLYQMSRSYSHAITPF